MSTTHQNIAKVQALKDAWTGIQKAKPGTRIREAAKMLDVSEAELLATTLGEGATLLAGDWTELFKRLPELGRVMSLTRNESCVLEHKGSFQKIDIMGNLPQAMATVIGPIESRVFFSTWKFGFAVRLETPKGLQQSLQFFDASGEAITKIYLQEATVNRSASNQEAFDQLIKDFAAPRQDATLEVIKMKEAETKPIESIDKDALIQDWNGMKDTHEFFGMIRKHQVNRMDAVVLAEGTFTHRIDKKAIENTLEHAAAIKLPIMIFVGNRGNIQIHQGKVVTIRRMDQWLNVLDPDFNMHLREDHIDSAWVVRKPTTEGIVTSLELFDKDKNMIAQFFGLRKPGIPELKGWKEWVDAIPLAESVSI